MAGLLDYMGEKRKRVVKCKGLDCMRFSISSLSVNLGICGRKEEGREGKGREEEEGEGKHGINLL